MHKCHCFLYQINKQKQFHHMITFSQRISSMEVEGVEYLSRWNSEAKLCNRFFPPSIGLYLQFDSVTRLIFTINCSSIEQPSFLETLLWRISLLGNRLTRIWEDLQVFLHYGCRWESVAFSCFLASFSYLLPNKIISTQPPPPPWFQVISTLFHQRNFSETFLEIVWII